MSIENILREATTVLSAAMRYSNQLAEVNRIDNELHRMRVLITTVAAHSYSSLGGSANLAEELNELQNVKNTILRIAEQRFKGNTQILKEFQYSPQMKKDF